MSWLLEPVAQKEIKRMMEEQERQRRIQLGALGWNFPKEDTEKLKREKDGAYQERNQLAAALARAALSMGLKAGVGEHPAEDKAWEADWRTILFIDLPTGQLSWHFHDSEWSLLAGLPRYEGKWDGHTAAEKYRRLMCWRGEAPPINLRQRPPLCAQGAAHTEHPELLCERPKGHEGRLHSAVAPGGAPYTCFQWFGEESR